jgi:hemoglobin/transferrin/lactoferrin receptor protein
VYTFNDANRLRFTWDHHDSDVEWNVLSAVARPPLIGTSTLALFAADEMDRDRFTVDHQLETSGAFINSVRTTVYYQDSHVRQFSSEDRNTAPDRIRDATFDNQLYGAILELSSEIDHGSFTQRFVYGVDYSRTEQQGLRDGTVPPVGETFPTRAFPTTDYTLAGVFIQDEITLGGGRFSIYPALRWDYFEIEPQDDPLFTAAEPAGQSDSHVSPKLGLVARLTDRVNLFANAGMGFKAPAPSQVNNGFTNPVMFYQSISNPDLDPETSQTFEVGLRLQGDRWNGSVTTFTGEYDDFIEQAQISGNGTPASPTTYQYVNLTGVEIYGAEAKAKFILGMGFDLNAAASYTHGESEANGIETPLQTIEPFKVVSGLNWRSPGDRYGGELFATYSGGKGPSRAGITCTPAPCFSPGSFVVLDTVGWWKVTGSTTLRAGLFNLTDEKYWWWSDVRGIAASASFVDAYSQPGRNVSVSLTMKF